jgi:NADH-quinone oxidoreductase subunit N
LQRLNAHSPYLAMMAHSGLAMILTGVAFKLALAPLHLWAADVFQGASAPVGGFIAAVSKAALAGFLIRFVIAGDLLGQPSFRITLTILAGLSMIVGNLTALLQTRIKRILAYSSIAHFGYLQVAILAIPTDHTALPAALFYIVVYSLASAGAFGWLAAFSTPTREIDHFFDLQGFLRKKRLASALLIIMLLSLAGIPLTGGFIGKFLLVASGLRSSLGMLLALLIIGSLLGLVYYLRIILALSQDGMEASSKLPVARPAIMALLILLVVAIMAIGLFPQLVAVVLLRVL